MHLVDPWANSSRWREHPVEVLVLSLGLLALALGLAPLPSAPVILAISAIAVTAGARVPLGVFLRVMAWPMTFLVLGCAALIFSVKLEGGFSVTAMCAGLVTAALVFLRSLAAVSAMMMLALSVPMGEMLSLLRRWHVPAVITELMGLVYRLLFVFDGTLRAMIRAQRCRLGYRTLRTSYRSLGAIVAALFLRAVDRARRMERALTARGYQGELRVLSCRHRVSAGAIGAVLAIHAAVAVFGLTWQGVIPWPM